MTRTKKFRIAVVANSLLIILSAFLPWLVIRGPLATVIIRGTDGTEGYLTIAIGILAVALQLFRPRYLMVAALMAAALAITEGIDFFKGFRGRDLMSEMGMDIRPGIGLILLFLSSLSLILLALRARILQKE